MVWYFKGIRPFFKSIEEMEEFLRWQRERAGNQEVQLVEVEGVFKKLAQLTKCTCGQCKWCNSNFRS
jgi:hypothetical protein